MNRVQVVVFLVAAPFCWLAGVWAGEAVQAHWAAAVVPAEPVVVTAPPLPPREITVTRRAPAPPAATITAPPPTMTTITQAPSSTAPSSTPATTPSPTPTPGPTTLGDLLR